MIKLSEQSKTELDETAMSLEEEQNVVASELIGKVIDEVATSEEINLVRDALLNDDLGLVRRNKELQGLYELLTIKVNKSKVVIH